MHASRTRSLLTRSMCQASLELEHSAGDLVAETGSALVVVADSRGRCGVVV